MRPGWRRAPRPQLTAGKPMQGGGGTLSVWKIGVLGPGSAPAWSLQGLLAPSSSACEPARTFSLRDFYRV